MALPLQLTNTTGLPVRAEGFEQVFLHGWQFDAHAVAAIAILIDGILFVEFFAFHGRIDAADVDHDIGGFSGGDGFVGHLGGWALV